MYRDFILYNQPPTGEFRIGKVYQGVEREDGGLLPPGFFIKDRRFKSIPFSTTPFDENFWGNYFTLYEPVAYQIPQDGFWEHLAKVYTDLTGNKDIEFSKFCLDSFIMKGTRLLSLKEGYRFLYRMMKEHSEEGMMCQFQHVGYISIGGKWAFVPMEEYQAERYPEHYSLFDQEEYEEFYLPHRLDLSKLSEEQFIKKALKRK